MKKYNYELLRIIACIGVIFHHVVNQPAFLYGAGDTSYLYISNITCFAVPIFLMITGFVHLRPERKFDLWRTEKKVLIPLLSFGLLYAWLEVIFNTHRISANGFAKAVLNFLQGASWSHMWYLYMIVGLYIFIPVLKSHLANAEKNKIEFLLAILFVFNIIIPTAKGYFNFTFGITIPIVAPYLFYCLLGYYLYKYSLSLRLSSALAFFGFILLIVWTSVIKDKLHYYSIPLAVFSSALFALFTALEKQCSHLNGKVLLYISDKTFGIYIVHAIIINMIYKFFHFNPYQYNSPLCWLGVGAVTFAASLMGVVVIRKIPIINKIFCV
ncbi:MAG: acyltransferase family protein [Oscillospiraceae bacterium]|nr:acyltransferase family protein [Oscillospiraceae bacterium]